MQLVVKPHPSLTLVAGGGEDGAWQHEHPKEPKPWWLVDNFAPFVIDDWEGPIPGGRKPICLDFLQPSPVGWSSEEPVFSAICGAGALPHEGKATRYTSQLQSVRRSEANHQCPDVAQGCRLWALQQVVLLTPCDQAIAYGKPFDRLVAGHLGVWVELLRSPAIAAIGGAFADSGQSRRGREAGKIAQDEGPPQLDR